jgi:hypothetical protein
VRKAAQRRDALLGEVRLGGRRDVLDALHEPVQGRVGRGQTSILPFLLLLPRMAFLLKRFSTMAAK